MALGSSAALERDDAEYLAALAAGFQSLARGAGRLRRGRGMADDHRDRGWIPAGVRRVLLRRNIAVDAETAQLVAAAVQAALQPTAPSRPPRRGPRVPAADCEPLF